MILVNSCVNLLQLVGHVGETNVFSLDCFFKVVSAQLSELTEHDIEARITDGIERVRRRCHRGESDLIEADLVMEMIEYRNDIEHLGSERYASANRSGAMSL